MSEADDPAGSTGGTAAPCPMCGHVNATDAVACTACGHGEVEQEWPAAADPQRANGRLFRVLVVFSIVCYLLLLAELFAAPALYSLATLEALSWNWHGEIVAIPPFWAWVKVALYMVATVSLYRFSWPGRLVYTSLLALSALLAPLSGIFVSVGIGSLLSTLICMADGAILVMAWTTPLRERFVRL